MTARIIRIGGGWGLRIPKALLEQTGLSGEVEVCAEGGVIVIRCKNVPRAGWDAAFKKMRRQGEDALLDEDTPSLTSWDEAEWDW